MRKNGKEARRLYAGLPIVREARTWAEIDLDALCHNYRTVTAHLRERAGRHVPIISVIKADAYGHGAGAVCRALLDEGCPISPDTADALNELIIEERKN